MFMVYGTAGRLFTGTLEQLRDHLPVQAAGRTPAIRPVEAEGDSSPARDLREGEPHPPAALPPALAAYARQQQAAPGRQPLSRADQVMTRRVLTVPADLALPDAWRLLHDHHIGQAPVVDARARLVGLVSRADLLPEPWRPLDDTAQAALRTLARQPVAAVMHTPVPAAAADTDLRRVASALLDSGLPALVVTDEQGAVIGLVSRSDLLRAIAADPPLDLWG